MPFKSKAQARACFARKDPDWDCEEWAEETDFSRIPEKKKEKESKTAEEDRRRWEEARLRAQREADRLCAALDDVAAYFKRAAHVRRPFAEVEGNALWHFGDLARSVLDYAYAMADLREPRYSEGLRKAARRVSWDEEPYRCIEEALAAAERAVRASQECARLQKQAMRSRERWLRKAAAIPPTSADEAPVFDEQGEQEPDPPSLLKEAGGLVAGATGGTLVGLTGGFSSSKDNFVEQLSSLLDLKKGPAEKRVRGVLEQLNDPDHLSEMQRISTQAMLADFLRNDEVISGYDPREVLEAYNEIASLSPRAASQPAVARALLRRRLTAGAMEPFESHQLTAIEKNLSELTDAESRNLSGMSFGPERPS